MQLSARVLASRLMPDEIPHPTVKGDEKQVSGTRHPDKFDAHAVTLSVSGAMIRRNTVSVCSPFRSLSVS